jgi:hypothetical protein
MIINQKYIKNYVIDFALGQIVGLNPAGVAKQIKKT